MTREEFRNRYPVAFEMLSQIGGKQVQPMIGVKLYIPDQDSLTVHFKARAQKGIGIFKITLNPMDWYEVEFYNRKWALVDHHDEVYADQLQGLIEDVLGLVLTLTGRVQFTTAYSVTA